MPLHRLDETGNEIPCGLSGCGICSPGPMKVTLMHDIINHPQHYTQGDARCECGKPIECIQVTEGMDFCLGNVLKYVWRQGKKNGIEDLKKAKWYLERAIANAEKAQ